MQPPFRHLSHQKGRRPLDFNYTHYRATTFHRKKIGRNIMSESENRGIPIYLDPIERSLVDSTYEMTDTKEWHPMNQSADRLLKCHEALHDIQEILEAYCATGAKDKKRRRLRAVFVPLHSFAVNLVDLLNQIQSDKSIHSRLPSNAPTTITKLKSFFIAHVPFERKGKLGLLRNRVSAHYESTMSPSAMRELLNSTDSTEIGEWLHISLGVLCDALKLEAYMWSACGPKEETVTMMYQEPLVSVLQTKDSHVVGIGGLFFCNKSPRMMVFDQIERIANLSQCLFERKSGYRIRGFFEDDRNEWARSLNPKALRA